MHRELCVDGGFALVSSEAKVSHASPQLSHRGFVVTRQSSCAAEADSIGGLAKLLVGLDKFLWQRGRERLEVFAKDSTLASGCAGKLCTQIDQLCQPCYAASIGQQRHKWPKQLADRLDQHTTEQVRKNGCERNDERRYGDGITGFLNLVPPASIKRLG